MLIPILALIYAHYEFYDLQIKRYEIVSTDIPKEFDGKKVLFVSDFQFDTDKKFNEKMMRKVVNRINSEKKDIIVLGGDYTDTIKFIPRFYEEMQQIKEDLLSDEEKILELPASSLDDYYRRQLISMSNRMGATEYAGTDQEFLNRQIYVLYQLLDKPKFNPNNVYSELDKEFLIEELKKNQKEVVENFEKSKVEYFIKENYENSGIGKLQDDSIYKFDKDVVISDKLEDQAILPEMEKNVYLTGFPENIIEELAKNNLKLKRTPLLLENSDYHGYMFNEDNTVVFIGGKKPKYYYKDYKINVVKKPIEVSELLKTDSNYYVSDFF